MSVYSRCVEARGTTSIESTPACFHFSKPVSISRCGSGPWSSGPGRGASDESLFRKYGCTVKPYSDWTASAGTTGLAGGVDVVPAPSEPAESLSSATVAITRLSMPWTYDTAKAPSEWPMIATFVRRPGVTVFLSLRRSNSFQYGLKRFALVSPALRLGYGLDGVDRKNDSASWVP